MIDLDDLEQDDEQPETLSQWYARATAELEAMRAAALAQVNEHFDGHARRLAIEVSCVERTMAGVVLN